MQLRKKEIDYKWVILIVCFFMEFICLGFCSSTAGLYVVPVTKALDIPRSLYSIHGSIRYIVQVVVALFFGPMVQRFGTKKLTCAGLLGLTGAMVIRAVATSVFHFYIASALLGMGIVFVGGTMAGTIVRSWFHQNVGRYTGIVMSANGIGGALAAQIVSPIINNGETFGYRKAYILSAIITLAFSVLIVIFLRDHASESPDLGKKKKKVPKGETWSGLEFSVLKRKPYFYLAAIMIFLTGISLQSIGAITIPHMTDIGLPAAFVATTSTVSSLVLTVSKFAVGFSYDKRGLRFTLMFCHATALIAFVLKALLTNSTLGMVMAITASCAASFALPLETVMIPLLTSDLFGSASYAKVLGVFMAMNSLGLCLGSPLGNLYYDISKTYIPCFWLFAVLMVVVAIGFQLLIRVANKDKERILAAQAEEAEIV